MEEKINHFIKTYYLLILAFINLCFAFASPDRRQVLENYIHYLFQPTSLTQDTFVIAGAAASFFNATILLLFYYLLTRHHITPKLNGMQVAAVHLSIGHSFFGLHILNVLPIIFGIFLYARWTSQSFKRFVNLSIFATGIGPLVSLVFVTEFPYPVRLFLVLFIGTCVGLILPPLAEHFLKFHQGFSLYNIGFTTGMIAMVFTALLPYFKLEIPRFSNFTTQYQGLMIAYVFVICFVYLLLGMPYQHTIIKDYRFLLKRSGLLPDDFFSKYPPSVVWFNMSILGITYSILLLLLSNNLNGPLIGGLISIIGFAAFGKHLANCIPLSLGVLLAALLQNQSISMNSTLIPFLFATSLAPISGYYGLVAGIFAGFIHFNLTTVVVDLHHGLTLYNNGFTSGFVAAFLVPIIDTIKQNKPNIM